MEVNMSREVKLLPSEIRVNMVAEKRCFHYRKMSHCKPNLIDPRACDGPVKVYTKEEIEAYNKELNLC